ncbi:MAG: hypothetical protein EOP48_18495, partial [Sphingobacteriales bacterium]
MKLLYLFVTCFLCCGPRYTFSQRHVKLSSPDGNIQYVFRLKGKLPFYSVSFRNTPLIKNSGLGLAFLESGTFKTDLKTTKPIFREAVENYELVVGKVKTVKHPFKEVIIPLEENTTPNRKIRLVVRAFNDGLAFRYEFPEQEKWASYALTSENSDFNMVGDPELLTLFLPGYTTSHEGEYSSLLLSQVKEDTLMDMPTLFEFPNHTYVAITEAALVNYAGMYLMKRNGTLTTVLSPLPGSVSGSSIVNDAVKVKARLPHRSPWRVLMISDRIGGLIESNILTSLNEPNTIKDVSWMTSLQMLQLDEYAAFDQKGIDKLNLVSLYIDNNKNIHNVSHMTKLRYLWAAGRSAINQKGIQNLNLIVFNAKNNVNIKDVSHMKNLKCLDASGTCGIKQNGIQGLQLTHLTATNNKYLEHTPK